MSDDQLVLFPSGKPGRGTAGEKTRPLASVPVDLTEASSLTAAGAAFYGHMIRQGFSDNTVKAFQADLRLFTKYMAADTPVNKIEQADIDRFLTWMRADRGVPCSPKTYARRLTTLKVFFGWLAESGVIDHDPAAPVAHDRPTTPLPEILYDDSVNALLGTARDLLWAAKPDARPFLLVTLILQTGIKKGECMEIKQEHVDLSNPQAPVLYVRYADPRRTLKERKLALGPTFTAGLSPISARIPAQRTYLRVHGAQSGVCVGGSGHGRGGQRGHLIRTVALDLRGARLSQRDACQPTASEARPLPHHLARDVAQDPEAGGTGAVRRKAGSSALRLSWATVRDRPYA